MECEIKLALDAAGAGKIRKLALLRPPAGARPAARGHVDRYFDTADFTLWRHGYALRVRSGGGRHLQTLKGGGAVVAGLHSRVELESEVGSDAPDRELFARQLRAALPALADGFDVRAAKLEPVFENLVERSAWMLALDDDTLVECALDIGELRRGGRKLPVRELELEIKQGDPARLYELARQVHAALPVRIENASKAERGYALAGWVAPTAVKAAPVAFARKASMGQALCAILGNCLQQMQANQPGALAGEPESLHQLRVGLRRLRAALDMVRRMARLPAPLADDLAWLADQLGTARNWDVFVDALLPGLPLPERYRPALARVEAAARAQAQQSHAHVRTALGAVRYTDLMLGLGAWIAGQGWRAEGPPVPALARKVGKSAPELVRHAAARVRKRARGIDLARPATLHRVRIAVKKERYAREFFASLGDGRKALRRHELLSAMQEELGLLNDEVVARGLLAELAGRVPQEAALLGFVEGVLAARAQAALARAGKRVRRKLRARAPS